MAEGNIMELPQNSLKTRLLNDPAISLLDIYPKVLKSGSWGDLCLSTFTAALFTVAKINYLSVHQLTNG